MACLSPDITINRPEALNATNARLHWKLTKVWAVVFERSLAMEMLCLLGEGLAAIREKRAPQIPSAKS